MPALDRALALVERGHIAVLVGQHLELDVARLLDELLHVEIAVAEGICRLAVGGVEEIGQLLGAADDSHAAPAAARLGLEDHRETDLLGPVLRLFHPGKNAVGAGKNRHFSLLHRLARLLLFAHQTGDLGRRTDKLDVRGAADLGEVGVLAQQPVAGMNRFHIGDLGGRDHGRHIQVAVGQPRRTDADGFVGEAHVQRVAVRLAVDGDGANAQLATGIENAQRDFAAIGNQNFTEHSIPFAS